MYLCSVSMFSRGCYKQETQCTVKARGLSKHMYSYWRLRKKGASTQLKYVKGTEVKFPFDARKPLFSGMLQCCFLSTASWEIVTLAFID